MKNLKLDLHILQNFAPANLNRDDANMPKEAELGGYRRARISSQCLKRSIRKSEGFERLIKVDIGFRTKYAHDILTKIFIEKYGKESKDAEKLSAGILKKITGGFATKKKDEEDAREKTKVLFYTQKSELERIAEKVIAKLESDTKLNDAFYKSAYTDFLKENSNRIDTTDIALFGRMLADAPGMKIDAACQVAHAISTNKLNSEFDFYTAVDDLNEGEEQGAGMMGTLGFNSSCFYRYAMIDANKLVENLNNKEEMAKDGILGFIEGSIEAIPTGKQNSHAAQNRPAYIMVEIKEDGLPMSLANAFAKPVTPDKNNDLIEKSIKVLTEHYENTKRMYGDENSTVFVASLYDNTSLSVPELIKKVDDKLTELMQIEGE